MKKIYLDHINGTPVLPEVIDAMLPYLKENFGNPQSMHSFGEAALEGLGQAREQVAALIGAAPAEVYFTSCGTESNNMAIKGLALAYQKKGNHVVLSSVEHQSVLNSGKTLEKQGFIVTYVPVDKYGLVSPDDLKRALNPHTILVSIQLANSEVGTIQPVAELARMVKEHGALFHTDAVAAAGYLPVNVKELPVDALSLAATQFYGPKGAAALYVRKGVRLVPFIDGGIQEEGRRAGTENVPAIVGMGRAAQLAQNEMTTRIARFMQLRDALITGLQGKIERVYLTGHPAQRLPHHASFCVEFIEGEAMLLTLTMQGVAVSSGSVCTSKALKSSHVLTAMGVDDAVAQGSIVFSLGLDTTPDDVRRVVEIFPPIVDKLRKMSPLYTQYLKEQGKR
jgi:cysteine desulfurase